MKAKEKSILVVEDNPEIRLNLKHLIESEGYLVFVAENGKEALRKLDILQKTGHPCLVITDLMMPTMTGQELVKIMKATDILISIPVVVMTASDETVKGVKMIRKPFHLENILSVIEQYCGSCK